VCLSFFCVCFFFFCVLFVWFGIFLSRIHMRLRNSLFNFFNFPLLNFGIFRLGSFWVAFICDSETPFSIF
jgi:hypothetical protein